MITRRTRVLNSSTTDSVKTKTKDVESKIKQKVNAKKKEVIKLNLASPTVKIPRSQNLANTLFQLQCGFKHQILQEKPIFESITDRISNFVPFTTSSPFDRRVTVIQWHPNYQNILVAASKGGDIYSWNLDNSAQDILISGSGAGGTITAMKINKNDTENVFVSSLTAEVVAHNLVKRTGVTLFPADGDQYTNWFVSLDVNFNRGLLAAGDCKGKLYFSSFNGDNKWGHPKAHSKKISHIEFHPNDLNLMITASIDSKVKIWDLRFMKECLRILEHTNPVDCACFSKTDGTMLATTDQNDLINIYKAPFWELSRSIKHPHRHFQYISPIKASWHPLSDILVIGRFPCSNFLQNDKRTLDFYNAVDGKELLRLKHYEVTGILPINEFNLTGECLASATGGHIIIWKSNFLKEQKILKMAKLLDIHPSYQTKKKAKPKNSSASLKNHDYCKTVTANKGRANAKRK